MDAEQRFRQYVQVAQALQVARRWEQAARAWIDAARVCIDEGSIPSARQALDAAGEAFRRDDRLEEARTALEQVTELQPTPAEATLARIRMAGILGELGRPRDGLALCQSLHDWQGPARPMMLDTWIGLTWQVGRKPDVHGLLDQLRDVEPEPAIAHRFRRGQLLRSDGALDAASGCLVEVIDLLRGRDGAEAGMAAARTELAEIDVLRGRPSAALDAFEKAAALHEAAGRRSLAYRSEAGRVRAAVEAGLDVLPTGIEEGLGYARDRNLIAMAVGLRIALGMALAARDPVGAAEILTAAIHGAEQIGSRLEAGRARYELATRTPMSEDRRRSLLETAVDELADHVPLRDRAVHAIRRGA